MHVSWIPKTFEINLEVLFFTTKFLLSNSHGFTFSSWACQIVGNFICLLFFMAFYMCFWGQGWTRCGKRMVDFLWFSLNLVMVTINALGVVQTKGLGGESTLQRGQDFYHICFFFRGPMFEF